MKKLLIIAAMAIMHSASFSQHQHKANETHKEIISLRELDLITQNPFGIDKLSWIKAYNKTNLLLEKIDEDSFLNYVILQAKGEFSLRSYFIHSIENELTKDMQQLIYGVYKSEIDESTISKYFTSLQPKWLDLYKAFEKNKSNIISNTSFRGKDDNNPSPLGCGSACTNPGFENGTTFWNYSTGWACDQPDPCTMVAGLNPTQHVITSAGNNDPVVGAALPQVDPLGGNTSALMLGNGPINGNGAARASISFDVTPANTIFTYRYAVVLEDPGNGHADPDKPYFRVKVRDAAGNVVPCGDYEVIAKPPMPGFIHNGGGIYYKPWTTVSIPLSAYIGKCITIEFTSSDCTFGGHYGYAYIDGNCDQLEITVDKGKCGEGDTLTAPDGFVSYSWSNTLSGGTTGIVGPTNTQSIVVNQTGTYQVVLTTVSGPACTNTVSIEHIFIPSPKPKAEFTYNPNPASALNPIVYFIDESTPGVTDWKWNFGDPASGANNVSYIQNPTHIYPDKFDESYDVELIVEDKDECKDTVKHTIVFGPEFTFFIPNVFTPNGDGINDGFNGTGIGITEYDIWIFDRWGDMIWHSEKYAPLEYWNGKANDGDHVAQQDVYVWKVRLKDVFGKEHKYIGTVTLVR